MRESPQRVGCPSIASKPWLCLRKPRSVEPVFVKKIHISTNENNAINKFDLRQSVSHTLRPRHLVYNFTASPKSPFLKASLPRSRSKASASRPEACPRALGTAAIVPDRNGSTIDAGVSCWYICFLFVVLIGCMVEEGVALSTAPVNIVRTCIL